MTVENLQFVPFSRTQEQAALPDGRRLVRCYSPANPHYYADELGALRPIEIGQVEDVISAKAGIIALRSKNVVSAGLRKDSSPEKYLGLRPDDCQALNTESLEFSLVSVILDGEEQKIELISPRTLDAVTQDLGSIIVQSTRQHTRQMVPVSAPIKDFRIEFRLHFKGLTPFYRADLDEYWLYNDEGRFRFRIVQPEVIDPKTGNPLFSHDEDRNPLQNQVRHSLIPNPDGTWSYIKTPGKDFSPELWPEVVWLDQTTVYSTNSDGYIHSSSATSFAAAKAGGSLTVVTNSQTINNGVYVYRSGSSPNYTWDLRHSVFPFDVSALSGTVATVTAYHYGNSNVYGDAGYFLGTQSEPLVTEDWPAYDTAHYYGVNAAWSATWNSLALNAQGISDIQAQIGSGVFKLALVIYLNEDQTASYITNKINGMTYTDYWQRDPYIEITFSAVGHPAMKRFGGVPYVGINSGIGRMVW